MASRAVPVVIRDTAHARLLTRRMIICRELCAHASKLLPLCSGFYLYNWFFFAKTERVILHKNTWLQTIIYFYVSSYWIQKKLFFETCSQKKFKDVLSFYICNISHDFLKYLINFILDTYVNKLIKILFKITKELTINKFLYN